MKIFEAFNYVEYKVFLGEADSFVFPSNKIKTGSELQKQKIKLSKSGNTYHAQCFDASASPAWQ